MADVVIVGIGNPYRGDDGAGWAVVDTLEGRVNTSIHLNKQRGDIGELLDIFSRYTKVYLVDASFSESSIGAWERIDAHRQSLPPENSQTSTHGLSVSQAIAFAKNLDLLPSKLIIYAIAGDNFNLSDTLSPGVAQAVDKVTEALLHEEDIYSCTNTI